MNILILNVHSALNLGDDAIMHVTLDVLQRAYPGAQITVAANDLESWRKYQQIEIVSSLSSWVGDSRLGRWRKKPHRMAVTLLLLFVLIVAFRIFRREVYIGGEEKRKLLRAYYQANLVISCGGGNFYAHRPISPALVWALLALGFALGLGKRVIMLPQSIGPIAGRLQRSLARSVLGRVHVMMLREPNSLLFVREVLKLRIQPMVAPDLAFGLPDTPPAVLPGQENGPAGINIGVTVIDRAAQDQNFLRQQEYEDTLTNLLVRLHRRYGARIYLLVQCTGPSPDQDDRGVTQRIYDRLKKELDQVALLADFKDAIQIKSAFHSMDFILGTRMHTGIFAISNAVPVVLIGYQHKACGMMLSLGLGEYCCSLEEVSLEHLLHISCQAIDHRQQLSKLLNERYAQTKALSRAWAIHLQA